MNEARMLSVLLAPHISEKSTMAAEQGNQIVFRVATDANKLEIKKAVENMFNVAVDSVRVTNVKGKTKRFGQRTGRRNDWKKAYVTLKEGQDINFLSAE